MPSSDLDQVVEQYHLAAGDFLKGNPGPYKKLFSQGEDVTLGNPFGPFARGWHDVAATMERASSLYRDGEITSFDHVATYRTPDLAYIVEVERFRVKVGGRQDMSPVVLRTTSILRREDGAWRIVHRHADPIASVQSADSVIQK